MHGFPEEFRSSLEEALVDKQELVEGDLHPPVVQVVVIKGSVCVQQNHEHFKYPSGDILVLHDFHWDVLHWCRELWAEDLCRGECQLL